MERGEQKAFQKHSFFFFFPETYLLEAANWSWDVPKVYRDITQEWLEKGI